jgi:hypothetical protein
MVQALASLAAAGKFFRKKIQFFSVLPCRFIQLALGFFGLALGFALQRIFLEAFLQRLRRKGTVRVGYFVSGAAVQVNSDRGVLQPLQVPQGIGMDSQGNPQCLPIQIGALRKKLLIDANCQGLALSENRKIFLELFQERTGNLVGAGRKFGRNH